MQNLERSIIEKVRATGMPITSANFRWHRGRPLIPPPRSIVDLEVTLRGQRFETAFTYEQVVDSARQIWSDAAWRIRDLVAELTDRPVTPRLPGACLGRTGCDWNVLGTGWKADSRVWVCTPFAGYSVNESDPFLEQQDLRHVATSSTAPIVLRLHALWERARGTVISAFPAAPGIPRHHAA